MVTIDPKETPLAKVQSYFQGVIAPRPIALASTVDKAGNVNLSPFSFFNLLISRRSVMISYQSPSRKSKILSGNDLGRLGNIQKTS